MADYYGTFQHRLDVLEDIFNRAKTELVFALKANHIGQCYDRVEEILAGLLRHYNIPFGVDRQPDGTHSYHANLLRAFEEPPTPQAIRGPLGTGLIRGVLDDGRIFRNNYKKFKAGQVSQADLNANLATMLNGLPLVFKALRTACENANVMKIQCPS